MIQLQRLHHASYENLGGLYLNPSNISELVPLMSQRNDGTKFWCWVHMNNGNTYLTPFCVTEILQLIQESKYAIAIQGSRTTRYSSSNPNTSNTCHE